MAACRKGGPCDACRGKHLPTFTPSMDMGGYVVIINAEKVLPQQPWDAH